jgi:hypothetical protein
LWGTGADFWGIGKNESGVTQTGAYPWPDGEVRLHPANPGQGGSATGNVVVSWLAPVTTSVDVDYSFSNVPNGGNGVAVGIFHDSTTLRALSNPGQAGASATIHNLSVSAGDRLFFVYNTDGNAGNDVTRTAITIDTDTTPGPIFTGFTENFDGITGTFTMPQYQSGNGLDVNQTLAGWTGAGAGTIHAVDHDGAGNLAPIMWGGNNPAEQNILTLDSAITGSNVSGQLYEVDFLASPSVYQLEGQASQATEGVLIEVLRADDSVLASYISLPGAWAGDMAFVADSFQYTGDGLLGDIRFRLSPSNPGVGRFGAAIDDLSVALALVIDNTLTWDGETGAEAQWGFGQGADSHWDGGDLGEIPTFTFDPVGGNAVIIDSGGVTVTVAGRGAYSVDVGAGGSLSIVGGDLTVPFEMTSAAELTIGGGGKLTAFDATLAGVTIGTAGGSTGTIALSEPGVGSDGTVTASNLTILDNSTLVVQGAGTLSFSGTSTVSSTGTSIRVSDAANLELAQAPVGVNTLQMDGGTIQITGAIAMSATDVIVTNNSTLDAVAASTADFGDLILRDGGILTVDGPAAGTNFAGVTVDDGANTGIISNNPLGWTGALTVDNTGAGGAQNMLLSGTFAIPSVLRLNNNAKVTVADGTVTVPTLAMETMAPPAVTTNTIVLGAGGTLSVTDYADGAPVGPDAVTRTINFRQDGSSTTGKAVFSGGAIDADTTTFSVGTGTTLQAVGANPLGASGAELLSLDGGTARFSIGGSSETIFTEDFNGYTGNQNNTQYQTGLEVAHTGNVTGWSKAGSGTMHAIDLANLGGQSNPSDWAIMFFQNNVITLNDGIAANDSGTSYEVNFDYGTAVYGAGNSDQRTQTGDGLLVEVLRGDNTVLASQSFLPGAWDDASNHNLDAGLTGALAYVGDGTGAIRLRIGPDGPLTSGRFEAEIDNLSVRTAMASSDLDMSTTPVDISASSILDALVTGDASFGALTFTAATTLTTSGASGTIDFASTALFNGGNTFNTLSDTDPGPLDVGGAGLATIIKSGAADLILDSSDPTYSGGGTLAFDVQEGRLIARAGSNPLGDGSTIGINGGEVVLVAKDGATDPTFDNPVTSTGGTLTAGRDGDGFARTVTLGNASGNNVTLTSGTLNLQTTDGYTLAVAGNVAGAGNMAIAAGSVTVAGTLDAATVTIDGALSVAGAVNVNELIANTGGSLTTSPGVSIATLTVAQDATLNAPEPLTVTETASLASLNISTDGAAFTLSGSDLSDDSAARTVTLQGDTVTFSGAAVGGSGSAGMAYIPITNDADSEIGPGKTYTHKIDFGTDTAATINTVVFDNDFSGNGSTTITGGHNGDGGAGLTVTGGVASLFDDMVFGDVNGEIELTGLTPGTWYDVRMYTRSWANGNDRTVTFLYDVSDDESTEETVTLNSDDASAVPPGLAAWDTAYAMSYTYRAEANGTLNIHANAASAANTYILYGLTNEESPVITGGISIPNTTVVATSSSTLVLEAGDVGVVTLGGAETAASATLTIESSADTIGLTNLTMEGASMVRSTQAAATGDVTVSADTLDLSGGMNYLGDATQLGGDGDDNSTNLTLSNGGVIDWMFDGTSGNDSYLDVKGVITIDGILTVNVLDGIGTASGEDIYIMVGRSGIDTDNAAILIDQPVGWSWDGYVVEQIGPSAEALILKNATFGTVVQDPGDTNGDRIVNDLDLANFQEAFGLSGAELIAAGFSFDPDFDNDGDADLDDFVTLREFFGTDFNPAPSSNDFSATPEPATMSLLALGALAILRRRRRK